jgi:hypothetical protein
MTSLFGLTRVRLAQCSNQEGGLVGDFNQVVDLMILVGTARGMSPCGVSPSARAWASAASPSVWMRRARSRTPRPLRGQGEAAAGRVQQPLTELRFESGIDPDNR